jgi:hypothetical protein
MVERVVGGDQCEQGPIQPEPLPQDALEFPSRSQALPWPVALPLGVGDRGYAPIRLRPF